MKMKHNSSRKTKFRPALRSIENRDNDEASIISQCDRSDNENDEDFDAITDSAQSSDSDDVSYDPSDDESLKSHRKLLNSSSSYHKSIDNSEFSIVKCKYCGEPVDEVTTVSYFPVDAKTELETLRLDHLKSYDERFNDKHPLKMTKFCVFDEENHLCPIDRDLIPDSVRLYFSGYIKPIDDDSSNDGLEIVKFGPVMEWWVAGLDEKETLVIGLSSKLADYCLMEPSDEYSPFMSTVLKKMWTLKLVIEFLQTGDVELTYDRLLNFLLVKKSEANRPHVGEDTLLEYREFVYEQVVAHLTSAKDEFSLSLIDSPCMEKLKEFVNGSTTVSRHVRRGTNRSVRERPKVIKVTVTPLVECVFKSMFEKQMNKTKMDNVQMKPCFVALTRIEDDKVSSKTKYSTFTTRQTKSQRSYDDAANVKECCVRITRLDKNLVRMYMKTKNPIKLSKDSNTKKRLRNSMVYYNGDDISYEESMPKKARVLVDRKCHWDGEPVKVTKKAYFQSVLVDEKRVGIKNFVAVDDNNNIAHIKYFWEDDDQKIFCHVQWFIPSCDTVLGDIGNKKEIFLLDNCENIEVKRIEAVVSVTVIPVIFEWQKNESWSTMKYYTTSYYCQKKYDSTFGKFVDLDRNDLNNSDRCPCCEKLGVAEEREIPKLINKVKFREDLKQYNITTIRWRDEIFSKGTCVFLQSGSFGKVKLSSKFVLELEKGYDEDKYPEKYRKKFTKEYDSAVTEPLEVGIICSIYSEKSDFRSSRDISLTLKRFYRPHSICLERQKTDQLDLNLLYWSEEEIEFKLDKIEGKCYVSYKGNLDIPVEEWTDQGPFRFYFSEAYDRKNKALVAVPSYAKKVGRPGVKTGSEIPPEYPKIQRPLRSLDVFAGCGGLTEGLHQSGVSECLWAIESCKPAARAFQENFKQASVFSCDSSIVLKMVMDGKECLKGVKLPRKGDVELLCGGPPCQGFSGMNRFKEGDYSKLKNSLIVNYLSYCDYYRPRYFILENVRDFVSSNKYMTLKMTLSCLTSMGYQVAFSILECAKYGIPQSRRRTIILAAAPGEILPEYPEPTHCFTSNTFGDITVDKKKYVSSMRWKNTAPYRMLTVRDAISDLPKIENNDIIKIMPYGSRPLTHFQKLMRGPNSKPDHVLTEHMCKYLTPLILSRIRLVPHKPLADWRDLPNIVVEVEKNVYCDKLEYTHNDIRYGRSKTGNRRGVCICASTKTKKYTWSTCRKFRQGNTLIPWCLPHTSVRHHQWSGLYGRLPWDRWFRTVVTNPEPMGKQGRVLHPDQDRVVSVRETARSQGFPDRFQFYGGSLDKYAQVGNAVAPPLGKALGLEIRKSVHAVESNIGWNWIPS